MSERIATSRDSVKDEPQASQHYHAIELSWSVAPAVIAGAQEPQKLCR
jgi:hypothetical protein